MGGAGIANVIIVAGGKGLRMGSGISKQYMKLNGEYIIFHTIKKFEDCPLIRDVIVVVANEHYDFFMTEIAGCFRKVKKIVVGGSTRQESVWEGLKSTSDDTDIVLVHDAVRPFVKNEHIVKIIKEAYLHKSCVMGVKVKDTIKTSESDFVTETLNREKLYAIQTPQAFVYRMIIDAHKKAICDEYVGSDDSVLVERMGIKTKIVEGSYCNIKITTPEDLIYGELLQSQL